MNRTLCIHLSDGTENLVHFGNVQIAPQRKQLLEERHYYPQGLVMAGISSKAAGKLQTNFGYQGKELQSGEWADGTGLEEYDFDARYYDVQLAKRGAQDPVKNYASPYSGMANNPVAFVDLDGKNPLIILPIVGIAFGGY